MTNESEERDSWSELVENLGVEPVAEENRPQPTVPPTTSRPAAERPRKPAPPRPAGDWSQLAGMLGIELPPEEPPTEPPPRPAAPPRSIGTPGSASTPRPTGPRVEKLDAVPDQPPVVQGFVERTFVEKAETIEVFRQRPTPAEPPEVIEDSIVSPGWSSEQRAEELASSMPEARLEDLPGYVEPPALLDDSDTIEEMLSYRDAGQAEMDGDDFASEPAVRRRRRRRGRRRDGESAEGAELGAESEIGSRPAPPQHRPEAAGAEAELEVESDLESEREVTSKRWPESDSDANADADSDADSDSDSDENSEASAEDTERQPAVRRRRRRRRRRGGEEREPAEARTDRRSDGPAAESEAKLGGEPEVDEDDDDSGADDDDFADGGSADDERSDDASAGRHRKIPTWAEAVTVVIDANMQSRTRSGGNSRGGDSRGRRRGRR